VLIAKSLFIIVTCMPITTGFFPCQVLPVQFGPPPANLSEQPFRASGSTRHSGPRKEKTPELAYFIEKKVLL
jgi:hypothetical protein